MMSLPKCFVLCFLGLCLLVPAASSSFADEVSFNRDIRPILSAKCFICHGPDENTREADLRLDEESGVRDAFHANTLSKSEAWQRIVSDDPDEQMPPPDARLKLTENDRTILRKWLENGATWEGHWSFIAPVAPTIPEVKLQEQVRNPIDAFLLHRLETEGIEPVGFADRRTLIRRLSLDLLGLPPTPQEVEAFVHDTSPQAYEKLVDRLLASPHFGERLAVYWLDVVRYADSVGYHKDSHREIWMYRDWVIHAFNENKPYDEFVTEQLAGDLMTDGDKFDRYRRQIASGYNRLIQTTSEGGAQAKEYLAKYSADRVRNTSAIFLGATVGCAECHDHKFDPFTAEDFYRFAAFFADIQERGVGYPSHTPMPNMQQIAQWEELATKLTVKQEQLKITDAEAETATLQQELATLEKEIAKLSDSKNWSKTIITNSGKPRPIRIFPRGNWLDESNPELTPAVPDFLKDASRNDAQTSQQKTNAERASRLELADWITAPNNPLTARVFVNRLWRLYFGEGISRTLDDLGAQGEQPSHPDLLDWLAIEFIKSDWNIKQTIKTMVMSNAYRRSSVCPDELRKRDPENRLLARQTSFRLPAELVRDNALAISGLLSKKMYGRSVRPYQPANYWYRLYKDGKYVQDHGEDLYRRGVYTFWRRSFWHPSLRAFDAPAREECMAQRPRSNTPLQSLVLLNDPSYVEAARVLAANMMKAVEGDDQQHIQWAFLRATARMPSAEETAALAELYQRQQKRFQDDPKAAAELLAVGEFPVPKDLEPIELAAWTSVARVILNLHETITRP